MEGEEEEEGERDRVRTINPDDSGSSTGIIIGCVAGALLLLAAIGVFMWKKRSSGYGKTSINASLKGQRIREEDQQRTDIGCVPFHSEQYGPPYSLLPVEGMSVKGTSFGKTLCIRNTLQRH
ncbi:hypothetical protein GJAV_G00273200 [Gymnothorax javanicus]|nr:hypothetical protein GJAV_G00273200 [Gymnothorax javanicus]